MTRREKTGGRIPKTIFLGVILAIIIGVFVFYLLPLQSIREGKYHVFDLSADGSCRVATIQWHDNFPELINVRELDDCVLDWNPFSKSTKIHTEQKGGIIVGKKPVEAWQWRGAKEEYYSDERHPRSCIDMDSSPGSIVRTPSAHTACSTRTCKEGILRVNEEYYANYLAKCTYIGKSESLGGVGAHIIGNDWFIEYAAIDVSPQEGYPKTEFSRKSTSNGEKVIKIDFTQPAYNIYNIPADEERKYEHIILSDKNDLFHCYFKTTLPLMRESYPNRGSYDRYGQKDCAYTSNLGYWLYNPSFFAEEERLRNEKERGVHVKLFECPVPTGYSYQIETFTSDFTVNDFISRPSYFCTLEPMKIHTRENEVKYNMSLLDDLVDGKTIKVSVGDTYFVTYIVGGDLPTTTSTIPDSSTTTIPSPPQPDWTDIWGNFMNGLRVLYDIIVGWF